MSARSYPLSSRATAVSVPAVRLITQLSRCFLARPPHGDIINSAFLFRELDAALEALNPLRARANGVKKSKQSCAFHLSLRFFISLVPPRPPFTNEPTNRLERERLASVFRVAFERCETLFDSRVFSRSSKRGPRRLEFCGRWDVLRAGLGYDAKCMNITAATASLCNRTHQCGEHRARFSFAISRSREYSTYKLLCFPLRGTVPCGFAPRMTLLVPEDSGICRVNPLSLLKGTTREVASKACPCLDY